MDLLIMIYLSLGGVLVMAASFFAGFLMDINQRGKVLKMVTKKPYAVMGLVDSEAKTVEYYLINLAADTIKFKISNPAQKLIASITKKEDDATECIWIFKGGQVYQSDKRERGAIMDMQHMMFTGGLPTFFVERCSLKLLSFNKMDGSTTDAGAISAILSALYLNERRRILSQAVAMIEGAMKDIGKVKLYLIIGLFLVVGVGILAYLSWSSATQCSNLAQQAVNTLTANTTHIFVATPTPVAINGTIVGPTPV